MKKPQFHDIKEQVATALGNVIEDMSALIVKSPCTGPWYEPEVPNQLRDD